MVQVSEAAAGDGGKRVDTAAVVAAVKRGHAFVTSAIGRSPSILGGSHGREGRLPVPGTGSWALRPRPGA